VRPRLAADDWSEDFIRLGNSTADYEKTGTIRFLAQDRTELARVDLFGGSASSI
jgi:hypothetical protein